MADFTNIRLGVIGAFATKYMYEVLYRPDLHYSKPSVAGTLFCIWYFTLVYFISGFAVEMGILDLVNAMYSHLQIGATEQLRIKRVYEIMCMFFHISVGLVWYTHSTILKVYSSVKDVPWSEVDRLYGFFMVPMIPVSAVKLILAA